MSRWTFMDEHGEFIRGPALQQTGSPRHRQTGLAGRFDLHLEFVRTIDGPRISGREELANQVHPSASGMAGTVNFLLRCRTTRPELSAATGRAEVIVVDHARNPQRIKTVVPRLTRAVFRVSDALRVPRRDSSASFVFSAQAPASAEVPTRHALCAIPLSQSCLTALRLGKNKVAARWLLGADRRLLRFGSLD